MPVSSIEERLAFLGLGPAELGLLHELRPVFAARCDEIAQALLAELERIEPARERLRYPGVREFMLASHRDFLLSYTKRRYDDGFVRPRHELGSRLESVGVEAHWVVRGFVIYYSLLARVATVAFPGDEARAARAVATLARRAALDAEIVLEGYLGRREEAHASATTALAREGRQLQDDLLRRAAELREAREQARLAGELASVGTLAAGLAHEIGTPMSVIQGHARLLQQDPAAPDADWRLQTILDQIHRISRIIRTLLRIARPERVEHVPVRLAPLVEESLEFVGERLRKQGIRVERSLEAAATACADPERLQQLLLNLLLNAADAMPEGGALRVDLYRAGSDVRVRIADTGVGIEANDLARVFEPFFTTKEAGQGNGLGLMVCKRIVAEHGGSLDVESTPGEGSVFTVRLPGGAPPRSGVASPPS